MTPLALQRVAVRMLFDPAFAARVRQDPETALFGLDPTERDVRMLRQPDPRAWETDPHRRGRALQALVEEFPASVALASGTDALDPFFSSEEFHEAIQRGRSLAEAFGRWIENVVGTMGWLETGIAHARRAPRRAIGGDGMRFNVPRGSALGQVPTGLLEARAEILAALGEDPVAALAGERESPPRIPENREHEWVFVLPTAEGPRVERLPEALGAALNEVAGVPSTRDEVLGALRAQGAAPGDDEEILDELLRDGLLVRV